MSDKQFGLDESFTLIAIDKLWLALQSVNEMKSSLARLSG
jgi:hypothetical protein